MALRRSIIEATALGLAVAGATFAAVSLSVRGDAKINTPIIQRIGEVYLDGLVASIRPSFERELFGDVERRMASAMQEQHGVKEYALVLVHRDKSRTNRIGPRELTADPRLDVEPSKPLIDAEGKIMFVSRRLGASETKVSAALDISPFIQISALSKGMVWLIAGLGGFVAAVGHLLLALRRGQAASAECGLAAPEQPV